MPDYLMMISEHPATSPAAAARSLADHEAFAAAIASVTVDRGRFRPRAEGKRVTRDGIADGSFAVTFDRGLAELAQLEEPLARYHLFYATRADLLARLGRDATADWRRALALATNDAERALLARRLN